MTEGRRKVANDSNFPKSSTRSSSWTYPVCKIQVDCVKERADSEKL